jgi:hypothetical protein
MLNSTLLLVLSSGLRWMIFGCVSLVVTSVSTYRMLTRRFGWGPRDT